MQEAMLPEDVQEFLRGFFGSVATFLMNRPGN
jgi:hypothetical protein